MHTPLDELHVQANKARDAIAALQENPLLEAWDKSFLATATAKITTVETRVVERREQLAARPDHRMAAAGGAA